MGRGVVRRSVIVASILAIVAVGTAAPAVPAADTITGGDWIAFTRDPTGGARFESGDEEIWAMRLDGTGAVQLTADTCIDITPAASPDGQWLAWVQKCGNSGNNVDILMAPIVYDAETGQLGLGPVTNVTAYLGNGADRWPQFSPDGTKLAFIRKTTGNFDIWRADFSVVEAVPAISSAVRVVRLGGSAVEDCCVTWSPDGVSLVWASNVNRLQQSFNLFRIPSDAVDVSDAVTNLDRSGDRTLDVAEVEVLTWGREYEGTPAYDADGTILFRCNCPNPDIYRLDPLTGIRTRLTTHLALDRTPEGYPGGILYSRSDRIGSDEIYVAGPDGSDPVNITNHPQSDVNPTWIPPPAPLTPRGESATCRVENVRLGEVYLGRGENLQRAIDDAARNDRLTIKGVCIGTFTLPEHLRLIGLATHRFPKPTLDANGHGSVLHVERGAMVRSLRIRGGHAREGGGILHERGRLALRGHTMVVENRARVGGGIAARFGTVILTDSTLVRGNQAASGGGIAFADDVTLLMRDHSSVRGNHARHMGGGVDGGNGLFSMTGRSTVRRNSAGEHGGGIAADDGYVILRGRASVIRNGASRTGGGVHLVLASGMVCSTHVALSPNDPDDPPDLGLGGPAC